jgi:Holliday junction DNA helicase RuvA
MIAWIEGILFARHPTVAVVQVGGLALHCRISLTTYAALPEEGERVRLQTVLLVRDDGLELFGFAGETERTLFGLLREVSGVGPRMAQGILSGLSVEEFVRALADEDLVALTAIKGVGRKTAERLVLELREKLPRLGPVAEGAVSAPAGVHRRPGEEEAILALRSLGYSAQEAERAVQRAVNETEGEPSVESIVKRALTLTR